jgi:hypothetical protein
MHVWLLQAIWDASPAVNLNVAMEDSLFIDDFPSSKPPFCWGIFPPGWIFSERISIIPVSSQMVINGDLMMINDD